MNCEKSGRNKKSMWHAIQQATNVHKPQTINMKKQQADKDDKKTQTREIR